MGTGGGAKRDASDDARKLRAIETIVRTGRRGSEWQEAGLLNVIEKILDGHGTSAADIKKLLKEASEF